MGEPIKALHHFSHLSRSQNITYNYLESIFFQAVCQVELDLDGRSSLDIFTAEVERIDDYIKEANSHEKQRLIFLLKQTHIFFNLLDKPIEFISVSKALLKLYIIDPSSNISPKGETY